MLLFMCSYDNCISYTHFLFFAHSRSTTWPGQQFPLLRPRWWLHVSKFATLWISGLPGEQGKCQSKLSSEEISFNSLICLRTRDMLRTQNPGKRNVLFPWRRVNTWSFHKILGSLYGKMLYKLVITPSLGGISRLFRRYWFL